MSRRRLALLVSSCLLSFAGIAAEHAAKAVFTFGEVMVTDAKGADRALQRGDFVFSGDTVSTKKGRAQIQFTDGGLASLQPNTQYRIADYNYSGRVDGKERGFFDLVIGSVRFVTGAVGSVDRKNFRIKTKVATIGIRGSGGLVTSCVAGSCQGREDGTYLTTYVGILTLDSGPFSGDVHPNQTYHCRGDASGCSRIDVEGPQTTEVPVPQFDEGYRQGEQDASGAHDQSGGHPPSGGHTPSGGHPY